MIFVDSFIFLTENNIEQKHLREETGNMVWEANLIEWMQTNLGNTEGFVKLFDFFGSEKGMLILILIVMFCWKKKFGQKLTLIVFAMNI